jgi:hypothetical protein
MIFDNAWCLSAFNRYAGRAATGDSISDADKYIRLTEGQNRVVAEMSFRCPNSLKPHAATLPAMTSASDGNIWTFGTDANGYAIAPMGKARIFPNQASFPDYCWVEGVDYVNEGTQIRLTNGRTWSTPLYWYGITPPADITASLQPALFPEPSRELIVFEAVKQLSLEGGTRNLELAQLMDAQLDRAYPRWFAVWKTQFSSGGALGSLTGLRMTEAGGSLNGQSWS